MMKPIPKRYVVIVIVAIVALASPLLWQALTHKSAKDRIEADPAPRLFAPKTVAPLASDIAAQQREAESRMSIGGGIALIVIGLIFVLNVVQVDIPWINEYALGLILILGGVAAILLSLTVWRSRGTRVVERRVEPGVDDRTL